MSTSTSEVGALNSTGNSETYDIASFTPPANCILTVFCGATATSDADSSILDTGGVLTWVERYADRSAPTFLCYTAEVGPSPVPITIRFDCTGDAATGCNMVCYATTGYDTANPVPQAARSATGAAGTTPAVTLDSARDTNNTTLGFVGNSTSPAGVTEPSGWTETEDVGHANPTTGAEAAFRDGGETNATVTWGSTSASAWQAIVIEIKAAAAAAFKYSQLERVARGVGRGVMTGAR